MLQIAVLSVGYKIIRSLAILVSSNLQHRKTNFFSSLTSVSWLFFFLNCKHEETLFVEHLVIST